MPISSSTDSPHRFGPHGMALITPLLALLLFTGAFPAQAEDPSPEGLLVAYSLNDGRELWRAKTAPSFFTTDVSSSVLVGRTMTCGTSEVRATAVSARNGRERWTTPTDVDAPLVNGSKNATQGSARSGVVVVTTPQPSIRGVDARSGKARWSHQVQYTPFVTTNSTLVINSATRGTMQSGFTAVVTAYDRTTGKRRWRVTRAGAQDTPAVFLTGNDVLISFDDATGGTLGSVLVDARTGKTRWTSPLEGLGVTGGVAFVGSYSRSAPQSTRTEARDAATGELLWSRSPTPGAVNAMGKQVAWFTGGSGSEVLEARTGRELYRLPTFAPQAVGRDTFAWADRNQVHVADSTTGRDRWVADLPTGEAVNSVAIGKDAVYVSVGCYPMD